MTMLDEKGLEAARDAWFTTLEVDSRVKMTAAITAYLSTAGAETVGWRDIESAPKDGMRILAVVDGHVRLVAWCKTSHVPVVCWNTVDMGVEDADYCEPKAWMHLPQPPATNTADSGSAEEADGATS